MFVKLGAAGLAGHGSDFGHGEDNLFGLTSETVTVVERYAGQSADIDGERPLVERREEAASECEENAYAHNEKERYAD